MSNADQYSSITSFTSPRPEGFTHETSAKMKRKSPSWMSERAMNHNTNTAGVLLPASRVPAMKPDARIHTLRIHSALKSHINYTLQRHCYYINHTHKHTYTQQPYTRPYTRQLKNKSYRWRGMLELWSPPSFISPHEERQPRELHQNGWGKNAIFLLSDMYINSLSIFPHRQHRYALPIRWGTQLDKSRNRFVHNLPSMQPIGFCVGVTRMTRLIRKKTTSLQT